MIKFKQGSVTNPETGVTKDIIVKAKSPNTIKDIVIGGSLTVLGIIYLTYTAFKNGSKKFDEAELDALINAGILKEISD